MKISLIIELDTFIIWAYSYIFVFSEHIQYSLYEDGDREKCRNLPKRIKKVYEN